MRKGVWMRISDANGIEQSSVMVINDHIFYLHSFEDGKPMLIDYEHEPGRGAANMRDVCELARKLQGTDDQGQLFAGRGAELLKAGAA